MSLILPAFDSAESGVKQQALTAGMCRVVPARTVRFEADGVAVRGCRSGSCRVRENSSCSGPWPRPRTLSQIVKQTEWRIALDVPVELRSDSKIRSGTL